MLSNYNDDKYSIKQNKGQKRMLVPLHPELVKINKIHREVISNKIVENKIITIYAHKTQHLFLIHLGLLTASNLNGTR